MHSSDCELTLYTKCFLYDWSIWFNGSLRSLSLFYAESRLEQLRVIPGQRSVSAGHKPSFYHLPQYYLQYTQLVCEEATFQKQNGISNFPGKGSALDLPGTSVLARQRGRPGTPGTDQIRQQTLATVCSQCRIRPGRLTQIPAPPSSGVLPRRSLHCFLQGHCTNMYVLCNSPWIRYGGACWKRWQPVPLPASSLLRALSRCKTGYRWAKRGTRFEASLFMALRVYKEIPNNVRLLLCEYARDHHGQEQKRRLGKNP